jgi:hypothetical protein
MISVVAAIAVGVWFYQSAQAAGKDELRAALAGLVVMIVASVYLNIVAVCFLWPVFTSQLGVGRVLLLTKLIDAASAGLGFILAWWIHQKGFAGGAEKADREHPANMGLRARFMGLFSWAPFISEMARLMKRAVRFTASVVRSFKRRYCYGCCRFVRVSRTSRRCPRCGQAPFKGRWRKEYA